MTEKMREFVALEGKIADLWAAAAQLDALAERPELGLGIKYASAAHECRIEARLTDEKLQQLGLDL